MTQATEKNASYLTEAILAIHNEVQSALDYINTVADAEGTDLGKSSALLSIENLRVKVPIKISIEAGKKKLEPLPTTPLTTDQIRQALPKRVGFVIERDLPKNFSVYSKVRVAFNPQEEAAAKQATSGETVESTAAAGWGEIEITFAPIKRA
ncbi:MAG: hypothetical protein ACQCN6_05795 [Candidatus Bathyarchaeia archaeon]|jgi:hypothetical protein